MIKSNSTVLGKTRPRVNITRREMLKQLNEQKDKMSAMVEAAHATRPTSNERSSNKKFVDGDVPYIHTQKYQNS